MEFVLMLLTFLLPNIRMDVEDTLIQYHVTSKYGWLIFKVRERDIFSCNARVQFYVLQHGKRNIHETMLERWHVFLYTIKNDKRGPPSVLCFLLKETKYLMAQRYYMKKALKWCKYQWVLQRSNFWMRQGQRHKDALSHPWLD